VAGWIICKKGSERYHSLLLVVEFAALNSRVRAPLKLIFIAIIYLFHPTGRCIFQKQERRTRRKLRRTEAFLKT